MILGYCNEKVQDPRCGKSAQLRSCARHGYSALITLSLLLLLSACTSPTQELLKNHQWRGETLAVDAFQLWVVRNRSDKPSGRTLHIYFSGDGSPWLNKQLIAADPSPRNPVALQLMSLDPNPAAYLGRPCYHLLRGKSQQAPCSPALWTSRRYSEEVVAVMAKGVQKLNRSKQNITIIGFSGGGVLATLVAERVPLVKTVVSIAANLDIEMWSDLMGYSPLSGSINPNTLATLRADVRRIHLIGQQDKQVPPKVTRSFIGNHGGETLVFSGFDHHCCWNQIWPGLSAKKFTNKNAL
ncbi:MAG: hypothetical protein KTR17_10045 [Cellvibrionaceae bacterium]|nr:hypothetical protein [Cellvibrionaceae bacterium]